MGKYKEYIMDLAEKIGKDFSEVTQNDIEFDFMEKAQCIWADPNSDSELKEKNKIFLPPISISIVRDGSYGVGDVFIQENTLTGQKYYYLVV